MTWDTTAGEDGDLAIFESKTRQLIGVGATVAQTLSIVNSHNYEIAAWKERALKAEEVAGRLVKQSIEQAYASLSRNKSGKKTCHP